MQIAQRLYEGREIPGRGTVGLITYMRTDSTRVSDDALTAVREHIAAQYGPDSLPESPRYFKSRRDTQDAHEAIRPTYLDLPPDEVAQIRRARRGEALPAHLGALRRLADVARRLRHDVGRDHGRAAPSTARRARR